MTTIQVLGAAAIAVVLAIPSWNGWTADSKISTHANLVNRDHKGDRLPLVPAFHFDADKRPQIPAAVARGLPHGCESAVSPVADRHLARIAIRCIS
jgi:hypothetical protein